MPQNIYPPEGTGMRDSAQDAGRALELAALSGEAVHAVATGCDEKHNLLIDFCGTPLKICREEADLGVKMNKARDVAILSRVGRPVCFVVTGIKGSDWQISRAEAQKRALEHHLEHTPVGGIIAGKITHMEPFGAFVDIGCGAVSFIGVENISVSRIEHPRQRFCAGQQIYAAVLDKNAEGCRITLTHRELLGTWRQNVERVSIGSTVRGIVRSVKDYGTFVELLPNLSGLAEARDGLRPGDGVAVYIKAIYEDTMKVKLTVIDRLETAPSSQITSKDYFVRSGKLTRWQYSPDCCGKTVERVFGG